MLEGQMWSVLLLAVVPVAAHPPTDLVAAATAAGRPAECMPRAAKGGRTVWTRARSPRLERYCNLLGRAQARLATDPTSAEEAARGADEVLPGRAAPKVIQARIALARGDGAAALALFEAALAIDARSVEQPAAMHDLARAQKQADKLDAALATYRVVVPRASLLPTRAERAQVLLEAAHVALAANEERRVDEALAYLREAARDPHHALRTDVSLSLVLALHRAGHRAQADALLGELRGLASWADAATGGYLANPFDLKLLEGLALERDQPTRAAALYRELLAGAEGPNTPVARDRLATLEPRRGR